MDSVDTIYQDYSARCNGMLKVLKRGCASHESYNLYSKKGEWIVEGGNPSSLICGIVNLSIGQKSGHLPEFIGEHYPQFSLRPLWVSKKGDLPADAKRRIYELGYNALVVPDPSMIIDGIPTILRCRDIEHLAPNLHGILWENHDDFHRIESLLPSHMTLYLYVKGSPETLLYLAHRAGPRTVIVFSSYDGCDLNPVWDSFRREQRPIVTPLMPIINGGGAGIEQGLWVGVPYDVLERTLYRMERHHFAGTMVMTDHIPKIDTLLGCHLWIAARTQWKPSQVFDLVDTWGKAFRPEWELSSFFEECKLACQILLDLKDNIHMVNTKLNLFDKMISLKNGSFTDILHHFSKSVKRII